MRSVFASKQKVFPPSFTTMTPRRAANVCLFCMAMLPECLCSRPRAEDPIPTSWQGSLLDRAQAFVLQCEDALDLHWRGGEQRCWLVADCQYTGVARTCDENQRPRVVGHPANRSCQEKGFPAGHQFTTRYDQAKMMVAQPVVSSISFFNSKPFASCPSWDDDLGRHKAATGCKACKGHRVTDLHCS